MFRELFFLGVLYMNQGLDAMHQNSLQYKEKSVIDSLEKPQYGNFHTNIMGGVHRPSRIIDSTFLITTS